MGYNLPDYSLLTTIIIFSITIISYILIQYYLSSSFREYLINKWYVDYITNELIKPCHMDDLKMKCRKDNASHDKTKNCLNDTEIKNSTLTIE